LTPTTISSSQANWSTLESQAANNCDLIANGTINGQIVSLTYRPAAAVYNSASGGVGPYTHAQLAALVQGGDTITVMGVPFGSGGIYTALKR